MQDFRKGGGGHNELPNSGKGFLGEGVQSGKVYSAQSKTAYTRWTKGVWGLGHQIVHTG